MTEDTMVEFYEPGIVEVVPQCRERTGPQSQGREESKGRVMWPIGGRCMRRLLSCGVSPLRIAS